MGVETAAHGAADARADGCRVGGLTGAVPNGGQVSAKNTKVEGWLATVQRAMSEVWAARAAVTVAARRLSDAEKAVEGLGAGSEGYRATYAAEAVHCATEGCVSVIPVSWDEERAIKGGRDVFCDVCVKARSEVVPSTPVASEDLF